MNKGPLHIRGTIRWKLRRARTILQAGDDQVGEMPIVVGNAIPKSGSTLLFNILKGLPELGPFVFSGLPVVKPFIDGQPTSESWILRELGMLQSGDIRFGYFHARPAIQAVLNNPRVAHFFIIRDPRDALVSSIFYAMDINPDQFHHDYISNLPDMEERLLFAINGDAEGEYAMSNVGERYARWIGWLDNPDVCLIRFEELVADREAQLDYLLTYLEKRGFKTRLPRLEMINILKKQMAPAKSGTFRKGVSGDWRHHFSPRIKEEFKSYTGDLLIKMGYEQSTSW